ncbi:MAG: iron ABC transporter permease [Gammaproteobacteria bacterium]|nr:iron ABC transporter permease [Gammaproteobacteria bacterium]MCI0591240.1 iron ABC transporter permease [Gammaproteobacteria bacterium]
MPTFSEGLSVNSWAGGVLLTALLLSLPVLVVLASVFYPSADIWRHLTETVLADYVTNSILLMLGVGAGTLILGVGPAWLVTLCRFPGDRILEWALLLPMAMPAYIIAYTYTGLFDFAGPAQSFLRAWFGWSHGDYWFPQIRSLGGAVAMISLVLYPYVYLLSRAAFIEQSVCVLEVGRTLGCGPWRSFTRLALPLARPAIIAGISLVLMEALSDYGTVQYFGVATFTTGIYRTWFGLGNSVAAAQLSACLMMFVLSLVLLERYSRKQARYHHTSTRYRPIPERSLHGLGAVLAISACIVPVALGFMLPVGQLMIWALRSGEALVNRDFFMLVGHSVTLAASATVLALALALFMAYGKRLYPSAPAEFAVRLAGMGYAVPGVVIAVGVMLPFGWLDNTVDAWLRTTVGISSGLLFSGTLFALLFAYMVRFLALSLNTVEAGLSKIKPVMDDAGRSFGLTPRTVLRKVHMPIMRGSLFTALLLVFVDVLKELPATLVLRPYNFNTLAVRTFELANDERLVDAAGPAFAIVLVGLLPVIVLSLSISRSRPGHEARP